MLTKAPPAASAASATSAATSAASAAVLALANTFQDTTNVTRNSSGTVSNTLSAGPATKTTLGLPTERAGSVSNFLALSASPHQDGISVRNCASGINHFDIHVEVNLGKVLSVFDTTSTAASLGVSERASSSTADLLAALVKAAVLGLSNDSWAARSPAVEQLLTSNQSQATASHILATSGSAVDALSAAPTTTNDKQLVS